MKIFRNTEKLVSLSVKYERILRFFVKLWFREISVIAIHNKEAKQDVVRVGGMGTVRTDRRGDFLFCRWAMDDKLSTS